MTVGHVPAPHTGPTAPEDMQWDWTTEVADEILESGGWERFAEAHAWYDPAEDEEGNDPPHEKGAYKLPHHRMLDDRLHVVWHGARAAMQVLAGARGGVQIPASDRRDVYRHLARHYEQFDQEPPSWREIQS
jgi:hypothetical protein